MLSSVGLVGCVTSPLQGLELHLCSIMKALLGLNGFLDLSGDAAAEAVRRSRLHTR